MINEPGYRLNVGLIIINDKGKLLLCKRKNIDSWQFPQGGIDADESPIKAAYRELYEEVGIKKNQVKIIQKSKHWYRYDLPEKYKPWPKSLKNFKGQTKTEFLSMSATDQEKQYKSYIDNRTSGRTDAYGNDISRDGRTGENKKSIEQPKVASQMDNTEVKSDLITADKTAPTEVEMTQDEINVANKRGKKTKTILTSVVGDKSNATLSKKVLLG